MWKVKAINLPLSYTEFGCYWEENNTGHAFKKNPNARD